MAKIKMEIEADSPTELGGIVAGLAALFGGSTALTTGTVEVPATAGSRRGRPPKDEPQITQASGPEKVAEPETSAETAKVETPAVTRDDVRQALVAESAKLDQSKRADYVQSILNPLGAKKLVDLPDDRLGEVLDAIKARAAVDSALD